MIVKKLKNNWAYYKIEFDKGVERAEVIEWCETNLKDGWWHVESQEHSRDVILKLRSQDDLFMVKMRW